MNVILVLMYTLKINLLLIIVENSRTHSINLGYIQSPIFETTRCTNEADRIVILDNVTDIPI